MSQNADAFDFLLGEWEIDMLVMPEESTVGRHAILNVHRILDGAALLDEIRHIDQGGHVNFRGATFRTYLPVRDRWYVLWMMANVEGYTELDAQVIDGEVHTTGKGRDPEGELVEGVSTTISPAIATPSRSIARTTVEGRGFDPSSRFEPLVVAPQSDAG